MSVDIIVYITQNHVWCYVGCVQINSYCHKWKVAGIGPDNEIIQLRHNKACDIVSNVGVVKGHLVAPN